MLTAPSIPDIKLLRDKNLNSIDVMAKSLQRLKELRPGAASNPMLQDMIESEIDTVDLQIRIGMIVQTRLQAAGVTVNPLSTAKAARLQALGDVIDKTIQNDTITSATLGTVTNLISTATEVRDLVKASTTAA